MWGNVDSAGPRPLMSKVSKSISNNSRREGIRNQVIMVDNYAFIGKR